MKTFHPANVPQAAQPQHIGDLLPEVLARYGLVPADVWTERQPAERAPQIVPLDVAFAAIPLPVSLS